jgi:retinol dehydrogenase 14
VSDLTAIVTGASSGLGLWTAKHLAPHVSRIALVCRDVARAEAAVRFVKEGAPDSLRVDLWLADLSCCASVQSVATRIRDAYPAVDVLVNNAGAVYGPRQLSVDQVELHLATNYLGHFLLTTMLLGPIARSGEGRIVNLTSVLHAFGRIRLPDWAFSRWYHLVPAYAQSKLAVVLFTRELARRARHLPLTVNCIDPGLVRTDIWRGAGPIQQLFARPLQWVAQEPEKGASAIASLALEPAFKSSTGQYFARTREKRLSRRGRDPRAAQKLWDRSCEWLTSEERGDLNGLLSQPPAFARSSSTRC